MTERSTRRRRRAKVEKEKKKAKVTERATRHRRQQLPRRIQQSNGQGGAKHRDRHTKQTQESPVSFFYSMSRSFLEMASGYKESYTIVSTYVVSVGNTPVNTSVSSQWMKAKNQRLWSVSYLHEVPVSTTPDG